MTRHARCLIVSAFVLLMSSLPSMADAIDNALKHSDRPAEDKDRDNDRKPDQVLRLVGLKRGMQVADLMAGGGYYTELLSRVVGEKGTVYAQNNKIALERFADKAIAIRLKDDRLPNVTRLDRELEDPGLPDGNLDLIVMVLFYHDTYWQKVDREKMNAAILKALKPGGTFLVIDHAAAKGAGAEQVKTLHRVEESLVRKEIETAGFSFVKESTLLRNPDDKHDINVFKPEMRGKTDRFIYLFSKPVR